MANRSIRLCRRESIDGTSRREDLKAPAVLDLPTWNLLWKMQRKATGQKKADKAERERGALWAAAVSLSCRCLPLPARQSIHPQFVLPAPTSPSICSPAAAHRVVEEENRTGSFRGSPRFRSLVHSPNHSRKPLPRWSANNCWCLLARDSRQQR